MRWESIKAAAKVYYELTSEGHKWDSLPNLRAKEIRIDNMAKAIEAAEEVEEREEYR